MVCAKAISDFEVLAAGDAGRRRHWTDAEKVEIVEEGFAMPAPRLGHSSTASHPGAILVDLTGRQAEQKPPDARVWIAALRTGCTNLS